MKLIYILTISLSIIYIIYIVLETITLKALRKRFKFIIHVNGIRGKSSTTRLIDSGLRECGFKVFSKTTGTIASIINTKGELKEIKRVGLPNIREQIKYLIQAYKEKAEVVVFECMAVDKELQDICENKILRSDITVITNVRHDHIGDMGETLDDIASALALTIPKSGTLVTTEDNYFELFSKICKKKGSKIIKPDSYDGELYGTYTDNIRCALGVCDSLNLDKEKFLIGISKYKKDIGAYSEIKKGSMTFLNGLSINDSDSIKIVYKEILERYSEEDITILLNSRYDRVNRALSHIKLIGDIKPKKVILSGSGNGYIKYHLSKYLDKDKIHILKKYNELDSEKVIFAIGNFHGEGIKIIKYIMEEK